MVVQGGEVVSYERDVPVLTECILECIIGTQSRQVLPVLRDTHASMYLKCISRTHVCIRCVFLGLKS